MHDGYSKRTENALLSLKVLEREEILIMCVLCVFAYSKKEEVFMSEQEGKRK